MIKSRVNPYAPNKRRTSMRSVLRKTADIIIQEQLILQKSSRSGEAITNKKSNIG